MKLSNPRRLVGAALLGVAVIALAACGAPPAGNTTTQPLVISAIPDQDPDKLQRLYGLVATYLSQQLGVPVQYKPVTDYTASVTGFKVGDLDLVWYGGLTGVQARLQVPGAQAIAQRDIDDQFHSVFIANVASGITSLTDLKGHTFTFGSNSSTSGFLMPAYYMLQNGVQLSDLKGQPGYSGSHDKTIDLVQAGTFDAGALNQQVWQSRVAAGTVDTSTVKLIWTTPAFHDYHWVVNPQVEQRYGTGFIAKIQQALFNLDASKPDQKAILDLFGAKKFVPTQPSNYDQIAAVGAQLGLLPTPAP